MERELENRTDFVQHRVEKKGDLPPKLVNRSLFLNKTAPIIGQNA